MNERGRIFHQAIADLEKIGFTIESLSVSPETMAEIMSEAVEVLAVNYMEAESVPPMSKTHFPATYGGIPIKQVIRAQS